MGRPTAGWGSINCAGAGQPGRVWQARTAPGVAMLPGEAGINVRKTARYASKDCDPLHSTVVRFLSHNICFRETLGSETLLIFPSLIKQKRPLRDEVETPDGVSYLVRGKVENLYAAFAVLLGYTNTFTRVTQWQNQAQYEFEKDQVCGFRMVQEREGELEFVLYHSASTPVYGRTLFQGLFEKFLYERDVEVSRFNPVICPKGHPQERASIVQRRREGKSFVFCGECGLKITLAADDSPLQFGEGVLHQVARQEALARLRSAYEANLARIKAFKRDRAAPRCYLSRAGGVDQLLSELLRDLRDAGVYVVERSQDLAEGDFVLAVWTPARREAWSAPKKSEPNCSTPDREGLPAAGTGPKVILLLTEGDTYGMPIVGSADGFVSDFRDETRYVLTLFDLVLTLYSLPFNHVAFEPLRQAMHNRWEQMFADGKKAESTDR